MHDVEDVEGKWMVLHPEEHVRFRAFSNYDIY